MYMDLDFGPPPELCIYEVSGQNGEMDLDSSPTDSVGLELVLQICFGGHEDSRPAGPPARHLWRI